MTTVSAYAAVLATVDDFQARVERNAFRAVLPWLRRKFRGELLLTILPSGEVEASEAPSVWPRDARWCIVEVDDLLARRLIADAVELGL